jgi:hypothetical protein
MLDTEINSSSSQLTDSDQSPAAPEIVKDAGGRALLVLEPEREILGAVASFRQAPFLAQLIATKDKHPQTRERRRALPVDAIGAYRAVEAMVEEKG